MPLPHLLSRLLSYALFVFLTFCTQVVFGKTDIFIAINIDDCINCNSSLYVISKIAMKEKITVIFPYGYVEDSSALNEKFEFYNLKNVRVIYDDNLFKNNSLSIYSTVSIVKDSILRYREKLKSPNMDIIKEIIGPDSLGVINRKNNILICKNKYGQLELNDILDQYIYITKNSTRINFQSDSSLLKIDYQLAFGKNYQQHLSNVIEVTNKMPTVKSRLTSAIQINDTLLSFLESVPFLDSIITIKNGKSDTNVNIYKKFFIHEYSVSSNSFIGHYLVSDSVISKIGYYLKEKNFTYLNGEYILFINQNIIDTNSRFLASFSKLKNTLVFKELLDIPISPNYIKYNLKYNQQILVINEDLVAYSAGNSVCELSNKKCYPIPIPEAELQSVRDFIDNFDLGFSDKSPYLINAIKKNGDNIDIIYGSENRQLVLLRINTVKKNHFQKFILSDNRFLATKIMFYKDYVLYLHANSTTLKMIKISGY